jgi:hypothetical protein
MRFTPLMGSLGRRDGDSLGKKVFLRIPFIKTALKSPRGRPVGGGDVHRIFGYEGISLHLCNPLNTCVTYKKQR